MNQPPLIDLDYSFDAKVSQSVARPYRGEIFENAKRFKLVGDAYRALHQNYPEQNGHFDISSAQHLRGPLLALNDPAVQIVIVIGATQVLKSVTGDIWIPHILEHHLRNVLVLFETDDKAKLYCETRFMDTIKRHPFLRKLLGDVNRHDITKTEIKVAGAKMLVGGLNESNVSSLSWPIIWISESYQAKSNGLLKKAIQRADRFPNDKKILIESRAGMEGEDLHAEAMSGHRVPLTWACPHCGGRQSWDFSQTRPDSFVHKQPFIPPAGWEPPKLGSYAGMKFDEAEKILPDGSKTFLTIDQRARSARWECFHCGCQIEDTKANRKALMDTYEQDYKITLPNGEKVSPKIVTFYLPKECAQDNSFEESAKSFLTASWAYDSGNKIPLQDWYMAERAIFYSPSLNRRNSIISVGSYDPNTVIPDEHSRNMAVDAQKHKTEDTVGTFWYVVRVYDKQGNSWQLARGFANSWEEWIAVQKHWKVPNARVVIDASHWTPQIMSMAASKYEIINQTFLGRQIQRYSTWKLFFGDDARAFKHPDGKSRAWSPPVPAPIIVYGRNGERIPISLQKVRWSNLSFELQLDSIIAQTPGMPKWEILSDSQLSPEILAKEYSVKSATGVPTLAFDSQLKARYLTEKNGKQKFEDLPNRQAHYRDCELMLLARASQDGVIGGHIIEPENK